MGLCRMTEYGEEVISMRWSMRWRTALRLALRAGIRIALVLLFAAAPLLAALTPARGIAASDLTPAPALPGATGNTLRRVLRLGVYFNEVNAWKDWRRLQRRHGNLLHALTPDVLAVILRDSRPAFALVADGVDTTAMPEICRQLVAEGTSCLVQNLPIPSRTRTTPLPESDPVAVAPPGRERRLEIETTPAPEPAPVAPAPEPAPVLPAPEPAPVLPAPEPAPVAPAPEPAPVAPAPEPAPVAPAPEPAPVAPAPEPAPVVPAPEPAPVAPAPEPAPVLPAPQIPPAFPVLPPAPESFPQPLPAETVPELGATPALPPASLAPGDGETFAVGEELRPSGRILISLADKRLYLTMLDGQTRIFPVAIGRSRDVIVLGETQVVRKRMNPIWRPTPGMRRKDPSLPTKIGPGPRNPMGAYALDLGWQYISIHGTNEPRTIGRAASSGCYRMHASDIKELFQMVAVGTPVQVVEPSVQRGEISLTRAW